MKSAWTNFVYHKRKQWSWIWRKVFHVHVACAYNFSFSSTMVLYHFSELFKTEFYTLSYPRFIVLENSKFKNFVFVLFNNGFQRAIIHYLCLHVEIVIVFFNTGFVNFVWLVGNCSSAILEHSFDFSGIFIVCYFFAFFNNSFQPPIYSRFFIQFNYIHQFYSFCIDSLRSLFFM